MFKVSEHTAVIGYPSLFIEEGVPMEMEPYRTDIVEHYEAATAAAITDFQDRLRILEERFERHTHPVPVVVVPRWKQRLARIWAFMNRPLW
jgi:hypothetical protein